MSVDRRCVDSRARWTGSEGSAALGFGIGGVALCDGNLVTPWTLRSRPGLV